MRVELQVGAGGTKMCEYFVNVCMMYYNMRKCDFFFVSLEATPRTARSVGIVEGKKIVTHCALVTLLLLLLLHRTRAVIRK